jgi:hypothetical protein
MLRVADQKERSQLLAEALREAAVLLAVLYPLETIVVTQFNDKLRIEWFYLAVAWALAGILFWWGVILEGRDDHE